MKTQYDDLDDSISMFNQSIVSTSENSQKLED